MYVRQKSESPDYKFIGASGKERQLAENAQLANHKLEVGVESKCGHFHMLYNAQKQGDFSDVLMSNWFDYIYFAFFLHKFGLIIFKPLCWQDKEFSVDMTLCFQKPPPALSPCCLHYTASS